MYMIYDCLEREIYYNIFNTSKIENNIFMFKFCNLSKYFYNFAVNYTEFMDTNIDKNIIRLCILFEYLYINQTIFFNDFLQDDNKESLDLLSFLNVNILINKYLNNLLNSLNCREFVIEVFNKTNYIDFINNEHFCDKNIKVSLLDIFFGILKKQINVSKNT